MRFRKRNGNISSCRCKADVPMPSTRRRRFFGACIAIRSFSPRPLRATTATHARYGFIRPSSNCRISFTALADALDRMPSKQEDVDRVRDAACKLKGLIAVHEPGDEAHDIARFVIKLIATDLEALVSVIYPERESSPA